MAKKMDIPIEEWYCFKEYLYIENADGQMVRRLLTPRADPHQYEDPFDYIFDTPKAAMAFLVDMVPYEECKNWVLVKETLVPVARISDKIGDHPELKLVEWSVAEE